MEIALVMPFDALRQEWDGVVYLCSPLLDLLEAFNTINHAILLEWNSYEYSCWTNNSIATAGITMTQRPAQR